MGWNKFTGALDLAQHPRRPLDRVMTTRRFKLKVGFSDISSFLFVFPFRKAPPSATNHFMNRRWTKIIFKKIIIK